ncbi:mannosyltransferase, partial [Cryomyces antarcticus]
MVEKSKEKPWTVAANKAKASSGKPPAPVLPPAGTVQSTPGSFYIEPIVAFYVFLAAHTLAALYSPIQDCDEVYNYWEPTHYLNHDYGMQTWEYSPDY